MSVTEELRRVGLKIGLFVEPLFINEGLSLFLFFKVEVIKELLSDWVNLFQKRI